MQSSVVNYDTAKRNYIEISLLSIVPALVVFIFYLSSENVRHWYIFPVMVCGYVILPDALRWVTGKVDLFDPEGLVGMFGIYFFFLTPLLHGYFDYYMRGVPEPEDWRDWLGYMAIINAAGLIVYRWSRRFVKDRPLRKNWVPGRSLLAWLVFAIIICSGIQFWFYRTQGGLVQFIQSFDQSEVSLSGMGLLFSISESVPILVFVLIMLLINKKSRKRTVIFAIALLVALFLVKLYFGGLRGSRNNIVWFIFWIVCLYHNLIRPFSRKFIIAGVIFITVFMYLYGFYKAGGIEMVVDALSGNRQSVELATGRSMESILLGDYGRSDIQARVLKTVATTDYPLAWGFSYVGDVFKMVPPFIADFNIPEKRYYGTMAMYYEGSLPHYGFLSTRLYGMLGEWMFNFGIVTTPLAFLLFGLFVGKVKVWYRNMDRSDARFFLFPLLINLTILALVNDFDNHLFFLFKNGFLLFILLFLNTRKVSQA